MSEQNQLQTDQEQSDQQPFVESMEAMRQTTEVPFTQLLDLQKGMAEMLRNSLDMNSWARSQSLSLTKQGLDNYIEFLEQTTAQTEEFAEQGIERMEETAQDQYQQGQRQIDQTQQQPEQAGQQFRQRS